MIAERRDRIRTVRVLGTVPDPLASRMRVERELGALTLAPRAMAPGAVLCIRRLRIRPAAYAGGWRREVDARMQELLRSAIRPLHEAVPANASAVLFGDEAELLACLARDVALGAGDDWWWRSLFAVPIDVELVARELLAAPGAVPAALVLLAESGHAAAVLRALPGSACDRIAADVARTFGITGWAASPSPQQPGGAPERAVRPVDVGRSVAAARALLLGGPAAQAMRVLPRPQRALLGFCVLLQRAPGSARNTEVLQAFAREDWSPAPPEPAAPTGEEAARHAVGGDVVRDRPERVTVPPTVTQRRVREPDPRDTADARPARAATAGESERIAAGPRRVAVQSAGVPRQPAGRPAPLSAPESATVSSAYAGVFYLVNAALAMELYGDFTQPLRPGIALPPGDFLALAGERACGCAFRRDPIWPLLAQLAGRAPHERPGANFRGGRALRRWLTRTLGHMSHRAASALGLPARSSLRYLCRRDGRIALTPTRVDVMFALASHPLPIRMAGLDRNPGWVPAAGRIIEFHYELP